MKILMFGAGVVNSLYEHALAQAGSAQTLLNSTPPLRTGVLAGREALEVCRARRLHAAFQVVEELRG